MSREPFEVVELLELIASLSDWTRRDIAAFRLSGRVPSLVGRRLLLESISLHGHFDAIDGRLLLARIDALTAMMRTTPPLASLIKRVSLSSWGPDSGWLRSDTLKRALSILGEGGGATDLSVACLGIEVSLGSTVRFLLRVSGSNLIRLRLVHVRDAQRNMFESCVNLQDLGVDGLRMTDSGPVPHQRPSLVVFRYSHSSGIGLARSDHTPDALVHTITWSRLRRLLIRLSWYRDVWVFNNITDKARLSLQELELEVSSFHRHNTRPDIEPVLPRLPGVRIVRMVLATHYHFVSASDCPPSALALFVGLLDCPRLEVLHFECAFGALLRRRYISDLRWDILDQALSSLGNRYDRLRVELNFVYYARFNVRSWDAVHSDDIAVAIDVDFLPNYFPLTTASDSIELVLL